MCLTLPAKVKKISNMTAELENGRQVGIELVPNLKAGDWALVNANLAIKKVSRKEAEEILEYLKVKEESYGGI